MQSKLPSAWLAVLSTTEEQACTLLAAFQSFGSISALPSCTAACLFCLSVYACGSSNSCFLQTLFEDKQLQQTIFNKHRDELRSLDERINEIRVGLAVVCNRKCALTVRMYDSVVLKGLQLEPYAEIHMQLL